MRLFSYPLLFVMIVVSVFSEGVLAEENSAINHLVAKLKPLQSIQGDFLQRQYSQDNILLQESEGSFVMQRPGLLRWETMEPFPQLLVSNGKKVWLYDPDLEQVSISRLQEQSINAPSIILSSDPATINDQFNVSEVGGVFILQPVAGKSIFQQLSLSFNGDRLQQMEMKDSLGQRTVFQLSNVESGELQPEESFVFEPPAGVDVLVNE